MSDYQYPLSTGRSNILGTEAFRDLLGQSLEKAKDEIIILSAYVKKVGVEWLIKKLEDYLLLGETRDDAAGEAFDKGARILGLNYPGGPEIEKCAKSGNCSKVKFPRALIKSNAIEFSFSGLKTSLLYFMDSYKQSKDCNLNDVAASYQKAIIDCLVAKMKLAIELTGVNTISIAGGVAKNKLLRDSIDKNLIGSKIIFPSLKYCTDNAAMISYLGEKKFELGKSSKINFSINPNFNLKIN